MAKRHMFSDLRGRSSWPRLEVWVWGEADTELRTREEHWGGHPGDRFFCIAGRCFSMAGFMHGQQHIPFFTCFNFHNTFAAPSLSWNSGHCRLYHEASKTSGLEEKAHTGTGEAHVVRAPSELGATGPQGPRRNGLHVGNLDTLEAPSDIVMMFHDEENYCPSHSGVHSACCLSLGPLGHYIPSPFLSFIFYFYF